MNNNYNNYNNQPMGGMPNQNMNYGPQPMPNQGMNNMNPGYNYTYQQKSSFKFPPIAKDKISIIGYIGAIIMAIGSFLDFATIKVNLEDYELLNETINYFSTNGEAKDGLFILVLAIIALCLVHFRKNLLALIPTGIGGAILLADIADMSKRIAEIKDLYNSDLFSYEIVTSYGPAVYVVAVGVILLIVHSVMYWLEQRKNKLTLSSPPMSNGMPQPTPQPMSNQGMNYNQPINQYPQNNQYPNNNMMM